MKSQKAVHLGILPSFTPLTEHNQCSSDNAVPVFLTGSSGRWLHEEAAINGFMPVLIGGDGRKGPYVSPVVHIPIDVIELAMQLLGRGFKAESILSNTEDCSEPVGSRKATRQRLKAKQGTGLSVFGEFVQMVAVSLSLARS